MKIIFLGNFRAVCSGSLYSTEEHLALSMEEMGHEVLRLQEDEVELEYVLSIQDDYDLFFYNRTWGVRGDQEKFLREKTMPMIVYSLDIYVGIQRMSMMETDFMFKADYVFTADGGHEQKWKDLGINHHFLRAGVYGKECYIGKPTTETGKIIFVGSYTNYHGEYPFRQILVDWLKDKYGEDFWLWGEGQGVRGDALNNLYASTKIVVGDSLKSPHYWSDRVYETLGRGGFLLHPKTEGMEKYFTDKKHLVFYERENWQQLDYLINYYLTHDKEREKIRMAGHKLVKSEYTYKHRIKQIFEVIKKDIKEKPKAIPKSERVKLNLGAGYDIRPDAVNLDCIKMKGVDIVHNLNKYPWPIKAKTFDHIDAVDVFEHLDDMIKVMDECHRILKDDGTIFIRMPDARYPEQCWIDMTHKRGVCPESFDYWVDGTDLSNMFGFYSKKRWEKVNVEEKNKGLEFTLRKV